MLRPLLPILLFAFIALFGGSISVDYALRHYHLNSAHIGAWRTQKSAVNGADDTADNPYARAKAGRGMIIALGRAEGMSLTLSRDEEGKPLNGYCRYILAGQVPEARFFTIFAADSQGRVLRRGHGLPDALFSQDIIRDESGDFRIALSAQAASGNWLATPESGRYTLRINLYDTPLISATALVKPVMPRLTKLKGNRCG